MTQVVEYLVVSILPSTIDEPFRRALQGLQEPAAKRRRRGGAEGTEER